MASETVLEDTPARLTLEVQVPAFHVEPGVGGARVLADGFTNTTRAGAPDLPWYRFQVASGAQAPSVSVIPEEWVELPLPQGLGGVARWLTPMKAQAYKDTLLFASAGGPAPEISPVERYRGMQVRSIGLSMGFYTRGSTRIRMLKRFRVQVTFSGARTSPDISVGQWLKQAGIKNVQGGAYLVSVPRSAPLGKAARVSFSLTGSYLKIQIGDQQVDGFAEDGVYSLSYETAVAINPGLVGVPVSSLRLYAGPKDTLPIGLSRPLPPTLHEIPIQVVDGDGTFDEGDSIIFYAHGTSVWKPIPNATGPVYWQFGSDPYSFYNYYYLSASGTGTPMRLAANPAHAVAQTVTTAPHYVRAEHDAQTGSCQLAPGFDAETGFDWYWYWKGGNCSNGVASLTLTGLQLRSATTDTLKGYAGDTAWIGMFNYIAESDQNFGVSVGGSSLPYASLGIPGSWYAEPPSPANPQLQFRFDNVQWGGDDPRFEGYTVKYTRTLDSSQNRFVFPAATGLWVTYQLSKGANLRCLRVEGGVGAHWLTVASNGNGDGLFTDSAGNGEDVQYFLYRTAKNLDAGVVTAEQTRTEAGVISDLMSGSGNTQYAIVAPDALMPQALALRNYRQSSKSVISLNTSILRTEDIYREWSGGRLSPMAIRDALQYMLSQDPQLHYVLLYGDGHYDYRNILNGSSSNPLPNYVPPFNWNDPNENFWGNPMNTDDFYGVLDSTGDWRTGLLDVALGRVSVQNADQAQNYFAKMQQYEDPATAGEWRGHVTLTADDATQHGAAYNMDDVCADPSSCHTDETEAFAQSILGREPGIMMEKIYLLDYTANAVFQKPEAATDLITNLNQGTLLFSFFGHGAYNQLADEVLMQTNDALGRMRNADMAFMVSVFSCTVGRFDKLLDEGMMEQFVRQKDFGAIVGFGASRESFPAPNLDLGQRVVKNLFLPETDSLPPQGVGDAVENAKNLIGPDAGQSYNKEKYNLLGEPVMVIRRPGPTLHVDSAPDTLSSLQCGTLKGRIPGGSGHGFISARILGGDVLKTYTYLANVNNVTGEQIFATQTAAKRGPILFERTVEYKDSVFSMDYFLPKEVPFGDSTAKIQFFAWDAANPQENTHVVANLTVKGNAAPSACSVKDNGLGPKIAVTGCNVKESGGVNFPDQVKISLPYCLQIDVTDSSGGVLSGDGPDEGTTVELTGVIDPYHPQPGVDDLYHKSYQLTLENGQVPAGTHVLKVTARDGFGNLSLRQVSLETSLDSALRFLKAFNSPNPVKRSGTDFYFSTTLPQDQSQNVTASGGLAAPNTDRLTFDLSIFNQLGYRVREFKDAPSGMHWDGTDAWGQRLANGVYFYQVTASWAASDGAPGQGVQQSQRNILVLSR